MIGPDLDALFAFRAVAKAGGSSPARPTNWA